MAELWTIIRLLEWTTQRFEAAGIDSPRADAERLLADALGCRRIDLYLNRERIPDGEPLERFREFVRRRTKREPLQFILKRAPFLFLELDVDESTLIPRPETEILVERAVHLAKCLTGAYQRMAGRDPSGRSALLEPFDVENQSASDPQTAIESASPKSAVVENADPPFYVLDVGTGSGCIALGFASCFKNATLYATDISADAVALAKRNAEKTGLSNRVEFAAGDLFDALPVNAPAFDLILSNPPYIADSDRADLQREVRDWEPSSALFAGKDGLSVIRRLINGAPDILKPGGRLVLEIGDGQANAVRELFAADGRYDDIQTTLDLSKIERVIDARRIAE
ncbi:MAG: HemK/PrmC family methyltransferase [Planctomycetota bacterium]